MPPHTVSCRGCGGMDGGSCAHQRGPWSAGSPDALVLTGVCTTAHTRRVKPRRAVWREHNLRHITEDHPERGVSKEDVEEVLADPDRREAYDPTHGTVVAAGRNRGGEAFVVAFVELPDGDAFPVHVRRGYISDRRVQR